VLAAVVSGVDRGTCCCGYQLSGWVGTVAYPVTPILNHNN